MVIGIDIDGTLLDIHTPWLAEYNRRSGDDLRVDQIIIWNAHLLMKPPWAEKYYTYRTPELYEDVQPLPGAVEGVAALAEAGHTLVAITADGPEFVPVKQRLLEAYFPGIQHMVFSERKRNTVKIDLLIDDARHNEPDILLVRPWSKRSKTTDRPVIEAETWQSVAKIALAWGRLKEATR